MKLEVLGVVAVLATGSGPGEGPQMVRKMRAFVAVPALVQARSAAEQALAEAEMAQMGGPPRPAPYERAVALAEACVAAGQAAALIVDGEAVSARAQVSVGAVLAACGELRVRAAAGVARQVALQAERAAALKPLLQGERLRLFEERGEPMCACADGDWAAMAKAKEWRYVRGPSGPLSTYETMTFVFRGDAVIERRQRVTHEKP